MKLSVISSLVIASASALPAHEGQAFSSIEKRGLHEIRDCAFQHIGGKYVWGGGNIHGSTGGGFDCSGLTSFCSYQNTNIALPRTAAQQYNYGTAAQRAPWDSRRAGDLVFFGCGHGAIHHVGVVDDDPNFYISAFDTKHGIIRSTIYAYDVCKTHVLQLVNPPPPPPPPSTPPPPPPTSTPPSPPQSSSKTAPKPETGSTTMSKDETSSKTHSTSQVYSTSEAHSASTTQSTGVSSSGSVTKTISTLPSSTGCSNSTVTETSSAGAVTSIVYTTKVHTITDCAPTVTNCPAHGHTSFSTETIPIYTTICPVTEVIPAPTMNPSSFTVSSSQVSAPVVPPWQTQSPSGSNNTSPGCSGGSCPPVTAGVRRTGVSILAVIGAMAALL